ncbi:MAG: VWA domain-containing protein [Proteobacteria bacterium]|nr:VWA domain-containing protein [Pseudomonadota bacterium]
MPRKLLTTAAVGAALMLGTALFAGVSKGAAEVRKFLSDERVNRIILLSDGKANQGPSSPEELASLGEALIQDGISVTTIGLGLDYNEDLMYKLAAASDGNPVFAEVSSQLAAIFDRELLSVTDVIASRVDLQVEIDKGVRPIRVLGGRAEINGQSIQVRFNQLYHDWENYIIVEVEVPPSEKGEVHKIANAKVRYIDMEDHKKPTLKSSVSVEFTGDKKTVASSTNTEMMISCIPLIGVENSNEAVKLRDLGKIEEARRLLYSNEDYLLSYSGILNSDSLKSEAARNFLDASNLAPEKWNFQRKQMSLSNQATIYNSQSSRTFPVPQPENSKNQNRANQNEKKKN